MTSADAGTVKTLPVGDITGDFFVATYQRGYRWSEHEVLRLLDDIRDSNGATYYLQPVVVKRRNDDTWELIFKTNRSVPSECDRYRACVLHSPSLARVLLTD